MADRFQFNTSRNTGRLFGRLGSPGRPSNGSPNLGSQGGNIRTGITRDFDTAGLIAGNEGEGFFDVLKQIVKPREDALKQQEFYKGYLNAQTDKANEEIEKDDPWYGKLFGQTPYEEGMSAFRAQETANEYKQYFIDNIDELKKKPTQEIVERMGDSILSRKTGDPYTDNLIQRSLIESSSDLINLHVKERKKYEQESITANRFNAGKGALDNYNSLINRFNKVSNDGPNRRATQAQIQSAENQLISILGKVEGETDENYYNTIRSLTQYAALNNQGNSIKFIAKSGIVDRFKATDQIQLLNTFENAKKGFKNNYYNDNVKPKLEQLSTLISTNSYSTSKVSQEIDNINSLYQQETGNDDKIVDDSMKASLMGQSFKRVYSMNQAEQAERESQIKALERNTYNRAKEEEDFQRKKDLLQIQHEYNLNEEEAKIKYNKELEEAKIEKEQVEAEIKNRQEKAEEERKKEEFRKYIQTYNLTDLKNNTKYTKQEVQNNFNDYINEEISKIDNPNERILKKEQIIASQAYKEGFIFDEYKDEINNDFRNIRNKDQYDDSVLTALQRFNRLKTMEAEGQNIGNSAVDVYYNKEQKKFFNSMNDARYGNPEASFESQFKYAKDISGNPDEVDFDEEEVKEKLTEMPEYKNLNSRSKQTILREVEKEYKNTFGKNDYKLDNNLKIIMKKLKSNNYEIAGKYVIQNGSYNKKSLGSVLANYNDNDTAYSPSEVEEILNLTIENEILNNSSYTEEDKDTLMNNIDYDSIEFDRRLDNSLGPRIGAYVNIGDQYYEFDIDDGDLKTANAKFKNKIKSNYKKTQENKRVVVPGQGINYSININK